MTQSKLRVPFHDFEDRAQRRADVWQQSLTTCIQNLDWVRPSRSIQQFEEQLASYCGVEHAIATASGSAALLLVMLSLGLRPGGEVMTVGNTFVATVSAIRILGGRPVLVDVDRESYTMDPAQVAERLSARCQLLLPVHLFGRLAAMSELQTIAAARGIPVVEEACQAIGAQRDGRRPGALADAAVFSFGREKPIASIGEGGAVVTNDGCLATLLRRYCNQGRDGRDHVVAGLNFRIDPLQAAVLQAELRDADESAVKRQAIAERYNRSFSDLGIVHNPRTPPGETHGYYVYVVEVQNRSRFCQQLDEHGIGWRIHYPRPVHHYTAHLDIARPGSLPRTEALAQQIVSLPLRDSMTEHEIAWVIEKVRDALS